MDHVAIMKSTLGFIPKILAGEKTIESRWYATKRAPWGMIEKGDTVYFKNSGESVTVLAKVKHVMSFANLTPKKVNALVHAYGKAIGIAPSEEKRFAASWKDKKYCILIVLADAKKIRPFAIDKKGFGTMAAWIPVSHIKSIMKT